MALTHIVGHDTGKRSKNLETFSALMDHLQTPYTLFLNRTEPHRERSDRCPLCFRQIRQILSDNRSYKHIVSQYTEQ